jgi:hypothetical protein
MVSSSRSPVSSFAMPQPHLAQRLQEAGYAARAAEARRDEAAAGEAWRRYRLIRDAARDPDELLAEGIALSEQAAQLAALDR